MVLPNEGRLPADGPELRLESGVVALEDLAGGEAATAVGLATEEVATVTGLAADEVATLGGEVAETKEATGGCFGAALALLAFWGLLLSFSLLEFVEELVDSSIEGFFVIDFEGVTSLFAAPGGLEGFFVLAC